MKKTLLLSALPLSLLLTACADELDGSDTADMGSDVTTGETGSANGPEYVPADNGLLQSDVVPEDGAVTTDDMMVEDAPLETAPAS